MAVDPWTQAVNWGQRQMSNPTWRMKHIQCSHIMLHAILSYCWRSHATVRMSRSYRWYQTWWSPVCVREKSILLTWGSLADSPLAYFYLEFPKETLSEHWFIKPTIDLIWLLLNINSWENGPFLGSLFTMKSDKNVFFMRERSALLNGKVDGSMAGSRNM